MFGGVGRPSGFNLSALQASYAAQNELANARLQQQLDARSGAGGPPPPWRSERTETDTNRVVREMLAGRSALTPARSREIASRGGDVEQIFGAYEALDRLRVLAEAASKGTLGPTGSRADNVFRSQLNEVANLLEGLSLDKATLLPGEKLSRAQMSAGVVRKGYDYVTARVQQGPPTDPLSGLTGTESFTINVTKFGVPQSIAINLADIGPGAPSLDALVGHINTTLEAEGLLTRVERTKLGEPNESGVIEGQNFGLTIKGVLTERLSFSAADTRPTVFLAGTSGSREDSSGQLTRLVGVDGITPDVKVSRVGEEKSATRFEAVASGSNGEVYTLGRSNGKLGEVRPRDGEDLMLSKFDSSGKLIWSRFVGAGSQAEGRAIAVSADGTVAISGSTPSALTKSSLGGGQNSFVMAFDSDGREVFTRQAGARLDDEATSLAFDSEGSLIVGGRTRSSMPGEGSTIGFDAYVQKLGADGTALWTEQVAGASEGRANAVALGDDGAVYLATNEGAEARLLRFEANGGSPTWTQSLGDARLTGLSFADGALFAAAETSRANFDGSQFSGAVGADSDAVAMRLSVDNLGASVDWQTRVGGVGGQSAAGLAVKDGQVFLAGTARGGFQGNTLTSNREAFVAALDANAGTSQWSQSFSGRSASFGAQGIAVSQVGTSSVLDRLGLPTGELVTGLSAGVMDQLPLRPGDHFFVQVDNRKPKKIEIGANETLRSLSFKVNSALGFAGRAEVSRGTNGQKLTINAIQSSRITLQPGEAGKDALSILGMPLGTVVNRKTGAADSVSDGPPIVALGLRRDVALTDKDAAKAALETLDGALRGLRTAYRHAIDDPTLKLALEGTGKKKVGAPPAYMQAQLANLQAGLQRLQAGGGSTSSLLV